MDKSIFKSNTFSSLNWLDFNYAGKNNEERVDNYLEQVKKIKM